MHIANQADKPTLLLRDYAGKFAPQFDAILEGEGVHVKKVGPRAPNWNAYAERWVQFLKLECLDRFTVFGEARLRFLVGEYIPYCHEEPAQPAKENLLLTACGVPVGPQGGLPGTARRAQALLPTRGVTPNQVFGSQLKL